MGCLGECWDLAGPPPDSILFMPPPPVPPFLQTELLLANGTSTNCLSPQLCESYPGDNRVVSGGEFIELPRKDLENWSPTIDDTWLLVLVASFIGVLLLGALLAMFLLKCREMNLFGGGECSIHTGRQIKINHNDQAGRDCNALNGNNKLVHPSETVLYHGATPGTNIHADNRMVWAALTPHGTQHFISENYPRDLVVDYMEADDHYERVDHLTQYAPPYSYHHHKEGTLALGKKKSFDNSGFVDYEYEDPTPLIESYQLNDRQQSHYSTLGGGGGNVDMRCASLRRNGGILHQSAFVRPRVSSPTRIEHPNLPPLNLYPHNTLKKQQSQNGTLNLRNGDTLPKYAC